MAYTTINKSTDYFNTKIYTGNGGTQSINVGFQPDWSWFKSRDATNYHALIDAVRGETKVIYSNGTDVEATYTAVDFTSTGYDLTHNSSLNSINSNGSTKVAWNWKANGQGSANTDGSINTTYTSANTTAGFSICKWTGTGSAGTIGHGLGAVPKMIIIKDLSNTRDWFVYHASVGNNKRLKLNDTVAEGASTVFNSTTPTSSVFSIDGSVYVNNSGSNYIAYCFAEKTGYSKFGSWVSNNSADGTFVYTGFAPSFVMLKEYDGTNQWVMYDNKRPGYNQTSNALFANASSAEATDLGIDILSNGYKIRSTNNQNTGSYIYMAFGQSIVGSNNIPATAR